MFWQKYLNLCENAGLAPSDAAKKLGLTSASCSGWKNGAMPRDSTLVKIANFFGVSVAYLKGEEPDQAEPKPPQTEKAPGTETSTGDRMDRLITVLNKFSNLPKEKQELVMALVDSLLQEH